MLTTGVIENPKPKGRRGRSPKQTIFDLMITSAEESPLRDLCDSIISTDKSIITDSLEGGFDDNKDAVISIGSYSFLVDKSTLLTPDYWKAPRVKHSLASTFRERYLYVVYEALSQMRITEIETTWDHFEQLFLKHVGDRGAYYAIIDTDCFLSSFLDLDKQEGGQPQSYPLRYKGACYFDTHTHMPYGIRKDNPLLNSFDETIIVICFADLPSLVSISDNNAPIVSFSDESDKDKGRAVVRVTVDPCLEVRYRKDVEVLRIRIKY